MLARVGRLVDELAVAPDPVARDVGAQVGARRHLRGLGRAGVGDVEHRARLRVGDAEAQEVERVGLRQRDEVGLGVAGGEARGRPGVLARADRRSQRRRRLASGRSMHVILPDGSQKELPDGASGADLAAAIGPGLARAALAIKVGGEVRDLARPLADGDEVAIVTNRDDDSLDLIRHDTAHVLAAAVLDLYPGTKISIGPPIEDGFYYDFEFPEGVTVSDADFEALEAKMREHVKAGEEFVREDVTPDSGARALQGRGPGLQGRADRGPRLQQRRRLRLALHQRAVHRPLPRPARALDRPHQGVQAALRRGRLLARRLRQHDAHAHLRDGLPLEGRPRRPPRAPRAGPPARPPQARPRARAVQLLRAQPRQRVLAATPAPRSTTRSSRARARCRSSAATRRSRPRCSTTGSCGRSPATGTSTARTCS